MTKMKITIAKITSLLLLSLFVMACNKQEAPDASGSFEAVETIISSEATGKILQLSLSEGQQLKAGQLVGLIDSTQIYLTKLQLKQNQKAILSAKPGIATQLESLKKELANAKADKDRIENLVKEGIASQKQLDDAKTRVEVLQAK